MTTEFDSLNLHPQLVQAIVERGYTTPSPIQAGMIPLMMSGADVIGRAVAVEEVEGVDLLGFDDPDVRIDRRVEVAVSDLGNDRERGRVDRRSRGCDKHAVVEQLECRGIRIARGVGDDEVSEDGSGQGSGDDGQPGVCVVGLWGGGGEGLRRLVLVTCGLRPRRRLTTTHPPTAPRGHAPQCRQ